MEFPQFLLLLFLLSGCLWSSLGATAKSGRSTRNGDLYEVGVGIGDVTGLAAGVGLMGYANPLQIGRGIHTRLFARTFIVNDGVRRVVFVSVDIGMLDTAIKREVIRLLEIEFDGIYSAENVLLSATHTHSGPGGYIQYAMYGIVSLGFHRSNFNNIVAGIVTSIRRAHHGLQPGRLSIATGILEDANWNRSNASYYANPEAEIDEYNVDKDMTLIRIDAEDGTELGMFNWFAVHATSMNNTNRLVSGDNKGYASMLFEYHKNPNHRPGKGPFVAGFASSNSGDASPNIEGALCRGGPDEGMPCDPITSTCRAVEDPEDENHYNDDGLVAHCIAFGPGENGDNEESTEIIGRRQYTRALELYNNLGGLEPIGGRVQYAQQHINMNNYPYLFEDGVPTNYTCSAALGISFAAGTEDGPGLFNFTQGNTEGDPFWGPIGEWLSNPDPILEECHGAKPILLNVGQIKLPYQWVPSVVETQVLRIGNLYLVGVPGEFTTMAGRRMRKRVEETILENLQDGDGHVPVVLIAGYSNLYTHYITTFEEYQLQRYEGASTLYGPRTLDAYLLQYQILTREMLNNRSMPEIARPVDLMGLQISLLPPVMVDLPPAGMVMGQVKVEPNPIYTRGERVRSVHVGSALRTDGMREGSYFLIERLREDGTGWEVKASDADWNTKLRHSRPQPLFGLDSEIEVTWTTSPDTQPGTYRIRNFGHAKRYQVERTVPYQGTSRTFQIQSEGGLLGRLVGKENERKDSGFIKLWKKIRNSKIF